MVSEDDVRQWLLTAFEYSYQHDDWIEPLDIALEGISAPDALRRPSGSEDKGIWDMVLHLAVWHENIVERVQTGEKAHPSEGAWPAPPSAPDEALWKAAQDRLHTALESVRVMLETTPLDQMQMNAYGVPDILCRFTHNGYHLGQIAKLREVWKI